MTQPHEPAVLFLVGPTASGKTAAALEVAARSTKAVEIVNADSRQIYRGMTIGTGKPTLNQLAQIPHHLIDIVEPHHGFSLATFLELARDAICEILQRDSTPIVVGGTGQYVWGLVEGWQVPEVPAQTNLRVSLQREADQDGGIALYKRLTRLDPDAANFIDMRNVRRVIRALEVIQVTGNSFSGLRVKHAPGFLPVLYGLLPSRTALHARIDDRVDAMIAAGWIDEVRSLLDAGYRPELPSFSSVGYRNIAQHIAGEILLEEAVEQTKFATHRLARNQGTWFKSNDDRIAWYSDVGPLVSAQLSILNEA